MTKKVIVLGVTGVVLLAGLGVGLAVMSGGQKSEAAPVSDEALQAPQQDPPLPTGPTFTFDAAVVD